MLRDRAGHDISYLRLSVTERCNMACRYCMPQGPLTPILTFPHQGGRKVSNEMGEADIARIVRDLAVQGVTKVRLTGGEPLIRKDIIAIARALSNIGGIDTLAITTNGVYLAPMARDLKSAGVSSVNIHIDSLRPAVHKWITGGDLLGKTLEGIESARSAGFREIKLNSVLMRDINDDEVEDMIAFASSLGIPIRFIELMPIGAVLRQAQDAGASLLEKHFISIRNVMERLSKKGELLPVEFPSPFMGEGKGEGRGPARYYKIVPSGAIAPRQARGTVGFIGHRSMPACAECNRIRVLADGTIKSCLAKIDNTPMHAIGG